MRRAFPAILFLIFTLAVGLQAQDADSTQSANVSGNWQISWQGRRGSEKGTLHLQQDGDKLTGSFEGPRGSSDLTGTVQGGNISFNVQMQGRRTMTLAFSGTLDGTSKMSGTIQHQGGEEGQGGGHHGGGQGKHTWSATRQQGKSGETWPNQNQDDEYADGL